MAKFVYRTGEFDRIELEAFDGEEISIEMTTAWALTRLPAALEFVGVAVQGIANQMD